MQEKQNAAIDRLIGFLAKTGMTAEEIGALMITSGAHLIHTRQGHDTAKLALACAWHELDKLPTSKPGNPLTIN